MQDELQIQLSSDGFSPSAVQHAAGEYTLTEASHPQWQCRITVQ